MHCKSSKASLVAGLFFALAPLSSYAMQFDGIWTGRANVTSVGNCAGADLNVLVDGSDIRGTALTDNLEALTISGTVNPNGTISNGSFASGGAIVASFTGTFSATSASGSWNDNFGCFGNFNVSLQASYVSGFDELWAGTAESNSGPASCGNANLIFAVTNSSITGSIETSNADVYLGTASLGAGGAIVGGAFSIGGRNVGGFSGSVNQTAGTGNGNWNEITGCAGSFTVSRIASANTPPVANAMSITVTQNSMFTGFLSGSDVDTGDVLTFSIVAQGAKGSATVTNATTGAIKYSPGAGALGADSFTFKVNDGKVDSNVATVSVTIEINPGVIVPILNIVLPDNE